MHALNKLTRTGPIKLKEFFNIFVGIFEQPGELFAEISFNARLDHQLLTDENQSHLLLNYDNFSRFEVIINIFFTISIYLVYQKLY